MRLFCLNHDSVNVVRVTYTLLPEIWTFYESKYVAKGMQNCHTSVNRTFIKLPTNQSEYKDFGLNTHVALYYFNHFVNTFWLNLNICQILSSSQFLFKIKSVQHSEQS